MQLSRRLNWSTCSVFFPTPTSNAVYNVTVILSEHKKFTVQLTVHLTTIFIIFVICVQVEKKIFQSFEPKVDFVNIDEMRKKIVLIIILNFCNVINFYSSIPETGSKAKISVYCLQIKIRYKFLKPTLDVTWDIVNSRHLEAY